MIGSADPAADGLQFPFGVSLASPYQTLLQDLASYLRSEVPERIELRCHGKSVVTSRTLLMARSTKFREMIKSSATATTVTSSSTCTGLLESSSQRSKKQKKKKIGDRIDEEPTSDNLIKGTNSNSNLVGGYLVIKDLTPSVLEQMVQYIMTDMCDWIDGGVRELAPIDKCDSDNVDGGQHGPLEPESRPRLSAGGVPSMPSSSSSSSSSASLSPPFSACIRGGKDLSAPNSNGNTIESPRRQGNQQNKRSGNFSSGNKWDSAVAKDDDDKQNDDQRKADRRTSSSSMINKWVSTAADDGILSSEKQASSSLLARLRRCSSATGAAGVSEAAYHGSNNSGLRLNPPTSFSNSIALFTAADEYKIRGLVALAGDVLQRYHLKRSNLIELWDVAQSCSYEPLKESCVEYMNRIPGSEIMGMLRK